MKQLKFESTATDFTTEPTSTKEEMRNLMGTSNGLFQEERRKRKLLSALLNKQTEINEGLREENECIQEQQRALLELLQEKDKQFAILRRNPFMTETGELRSEGAELELAGAFKTQEIVRRRIGVWVNLLRLGIERQSTKQQLEEIRIKNYNEKHLMAYQQFRMAMEHFNKYFVNMKNKRLLIAMSNIRLYAYKKTQYKTFAVIQLISVIRRPILNDFKMFKENTHIQSKKLKLLEMLVKRIRKQVLKKALNILKHKAKHNIEAQTSFLNENLHNDRLIIERILMKKVNVIRQMMGLKFNKWRMEVMIERSNKETESKIERISMISKKLLVISKFVSISEAILKLHKFIAIHALKERANENKNHKLCKTLVMLLNKISRRQSLKNALFKFKLHETTEYKESDKSLKICGVQIITRLLCKKIGCNVLRLVNIQNNNEPVNVSIYTLTNSLTRLLTHKVSSHFFWFSYLTNKKKQKLDEIRIRILEGNLNDIQNMYEKLNERVYENNEKVAGLKLEKESCMAKINELKYENAELRNIKTELTTRNNKLISDNTSLLDQLKEIESKTTANVSFTAIGSERAILKYEEAVLELNKAATERVHLNAKLSEKEEELIELLRSREELVKESNIKVNEYRAECTKLKNEIETLRLDNEELKGNIERYEKKCLLLQQTTNKKQEELLNLEAEIHDLRAVADRASKAALLEAELEEKCKSSIALASTIDNLANNKQKLVEELERCMKEMSILRENFSKQQEACSIWKDRYNMQEEEIKKTLNEAKQYKNIINALENQNQELRNALNKTKNKKSVVKKQQSTESKQMISQLQDANQKLQHCILEKNEQIDKAKEHVSELTKELVDSSRTIAEQQGKLKDLEDKLRKALYEKTKLQEKIGIVEQEGIMHRKEVEAILQTRQNTNLEKTALESANNKLRIELNKLQEEVSDLRRERAAVADYNKIKGDNLRIQQNIKKYEDQLMLLQRRIQELELERDRCKKDTEAHKKLLEQRKEDIKKLHNEMENYAKVLEVLEKNMEKAQLEKENAERAKVKAIEDMNLLRKKYMSMIGVEISTDIIN